MDTQDQIVTRAPVAPAPSPDRDGNIDAEILGAWLWPSSETPVRTDTAAAEPTAIEVSMLPETRRLLRDFPVAGLERPYLRHLEQRILRHPRDLLSHVRRLFLARALSDSDAIMGALADLFLVLGPRGQRLRSRLLRLVEDQLTPRQCGFFVAHLENGMDATKAIPDITESRRSKRVLGTTRIVVRSEKQDGDEGGPVSLARESVANGQYDVALALLEGALDADPGDKEVCSELLELYARKNLRRNFFRTYTGLLGRQLAYPERWALLAAEYESENAHRA